MAVDSAHVYWANEGADTIGRANLDGTDANQSFITGQLGLVGVAVDALVGAPPPAPHFLNVSPSRTNPGKTITVSGSVDHGCQTGHKGDTATIYSNAFKGATKQSFAGVPAVYASLSKSKNGAFSFPLKLSKKLKTGTYSVGGRCGGGNFGSAKLRVVKARSLESPSQASLQVLTNTYDCLWHVLGDRFRVRPKARGLTDRRGLRGASEALCPRQPRRPIRSEALLPHPLKRR